MAINLNNIKDPITDFIGAFIIGLTLYERMFHELPWVWEGLTGLGVGMVFFLMPDAFIVETLKAVINKFTGTGKE